MSVRTKAQYWIVSDQLVFQPAQGLIPVLGDVITVTTWNDTAEQNLLTSLFVGPTTRGIQATEPYDDTLYDEGNITGDAGSFDYSTGILIETNEFDTGRIITDENRLIVTLDGRYLFPNQGYTIDGSKVVISGATINTSQVVVITSMTDREVPQAMAFRIFKDMRGSQLTYRITPETTTTLAQSLSATADVIYVDDASKLAEPNLEQGIFGLITINGERISYRTRNLGNNTLSGLRRGTAGTGAASHLVGTSVYDIGRGNLLQSEYQNRFVGENFLADGNTTSFTVEDLSVVDLTSTEMTEAVRVYVGGTLQTQGYEITSSDPVTVTFDEPPTQGYQVTVEVYQGKSWYTPGPSTPSDGIPLQDTDNLAARFLRGE